MKVLHELVPRVVSKHGRDERTHVNTYVGGERDTKGTEGIEVVARNITHACQVACHVPPSIVCSFLSGNHVQCAPRTQYQPPGKPQGGPKPKNGHISG